MTNAEIVSKLWNLCNVLRDDGITYHQYVTELTYILFLKMAKETGSEKNIPENYRWDALKIKEGMELKRFYDELLRELRLKTPEEINEELLKNKHIDTFTIIDKEGKVETIKLENIGYSYSYLESLKEICEKQNSLFWLARIDETVDFDIDPSGSYDANKFERVFNDLQLIKTASDKNNLKVEIKKTQEGYVLIDTTKNLIDQTKCKAVIEEALKSGEHEVNLLDEVCYNAFDYTSQMRETLELYNQIDEVISYCFNDIESTTELLNRCVKDIELRLAIEDEYKIKALNKDGVNLGMEIIKCRYLAETGLT